MNNVFRNLLQKLGLAKPYKIQTFTYFIPSPPSRKSGYREKQFDKVFYEFINRGYRVLDTKTQVSTGADSSGMWVLFTVQATNPEAEALDLDSFFIDQVVTELPEMEKEEQIEGLYQINS